MDKQGIRQLIFKKRLEHQTLFEHNKTIQKKLLNHTQYKDAKCVAFYVSLPQEVDTHALLKESLKEKRICVPKVNGQAMEFYEIQSFDDLDKGCFDVLEPITTQIVKPEDIDLMIVPIVAYDQQLNRVGYGKGYYDRYMPKCHCHKIGLAYSYQEVNHILEDSFDIQLDEILTEND